MSLVGSTQQEINNNNYNNDEKSLIKICKHICEKKKRQCKFNAIRNCDYCVEHLAFNEQKEELIGRRVVCPLDPKHSVYEKNFEKHLKKCNAVVKCLGDFDVKDINVLDAPTKQTNNASNSENLISSQFSTYEELNEVQLKILVDMLMSLDAKFKLYDLEFNKLEDEYLNDVVNTKNDSNEGSKQKKHLKQISSIAMHVEGLMAKQNQPNEYTGTTCLIELGAGRGKLSYWFEQSRNEKKSRDKNYVKKNVNILLIERGSQRFKFDSMLKKDSEESNAEFERIRIDLKDLYLNEVPLIKKSKNFLLYGKHLCGIATDFSIRCLKHALEDRMIDTVSYFKGLCLAVCCHHKCEWESLCGKEFLEKLNIDSKIFYIIRSMSSWATHGERENVPKDEHVFGINKHKLGRICKNLIDYARLQYLKDIKMPDKFKLITKLFYYIESDVTLENSMIYAYLENI